MTTPKPDRCAATNSKKGWSDFTPCQQAAIVTAGVVQVTLLTAAQIDITRRPKEQIRGSKLLWRLLMFVNFIGPVAYFAIGRRRSAATEPTEEASATEPAGAEELAVQPTEEEAQPEAEAADDPDQA